MKIGVYAKPLSENRLYNGVIVFSYHILKALAKVDQNNEYFLYSNKPIQQKIEAPNFHEKIINIPKLWVYTGMPLELFKNKVDILFSVKEVLPLKLFRPPSVVMCYDLAILRQDRVTLNGRFYNWLSIHQVLKSADRIITISEATKNEIISKAKIDPGKIIITYPGYNDTLFKPVIDSELIERTKRKYKINAPYILNTCSTIWYRKNIAGAIRGFAEFKKRYKTDHKLVFTGRNTDDKDYHEVLETIQSLSLTNDVILTGFADLEDIPVLLSGAEAFLFPSLHEGFGIPIVEAMACGCPVITSNTSAMPEAAGDAGMLVDPLSPNEIAQAIEKVLNHSNKRNELSRKGLERARLFSWEKDAQIVLNTFKTLNHEK